MCFLQIERAGKRLSAHSFPKEQQCRARQALQVKGEFSLKADLFERDTP